MLPLLLVLSATASLVAAGPDNIDVQDNTIDMSAAREIADRAVDGLEGILGSLAGGVAGAALQGGGINLTALLQSSGLGSALLPILGSTLGGLLGNKLAEGEKYASHYGDKHDGDGVLAAWGGIGPDGRPSVGGIVARTPGAKQANVLLPPAYVMSFNKRPGLYAAGIMSGNKRPTTTTPPPTTTTAEPADIRPAILSALEEYFSTLTVTPPEKTSTPFTDDNDFDDYDDEDDDDWYSTDGPVHSTSTASAVTKPKVEKTSTTPSTTTKTTKRTTTTTTTPKPKPSTPPATLKPKTTTTTTPKPASSPHPTHNYTHETTAATRPKPTRPPRPMTTTTTTPKPTRPPRPVPTTTTTLKPTRPPRPEHSYQNPSPMPPRPEYNNHYETTTHPKPTWPPRPDYHYNHESTETTTQEPTWPPRPDHNYYYESTTARPYPNYPASNPPPAYQTSPTTQVPYGEEYEGHDPDADDHRYPGDDGDEYRYPDENGDYYRDPDGRPYHHYSRSEEDVGDTVGTVHTGKLPKTKDLERSHPPTHQSRRRTHGSSRTSTTEWPYHVARKPQWTREPLPSGSKWPPAPGRFLEDVHPEKE